MSESDSDLDFQSADEDTEFDPVSAKSQNLSACLAKEISPNADVKTTNANNSEKVKKPTQLGNACNEFSVENNTNRNLISGNNSATSENSAKNKQLPIREDKILSQSDSTTEKDSTILKNDVNLIRKDENNSCQIISSDKIISDECDKDDTFIVEESAREKLSEEFSTENVRKTDVKLNRDSNEPRREKERVVLRREKKLYEKQQQLSQEISAQKEKASDLINILKDPQETQQTSWGFSSWGSSLLSSAASSVSTFSSQVSQGIGTVLETVENTLGAPEPEELARSLSERKKEVDSERSEEIETDAKVSLLPDMSSWTKVFENTGSKVIMGGLDTLELIGKKTMDILTEGDPGLRKKRSAFTGVNLSEILREAKAKADEEDNKDDSENNDNIHYSQIFDEKQGLVHLEALEMLSKQSQVKLQRLLMRHTKNVKVKKQLEEIKSICENILSVDDLSDCEKFDDFETVFKKHTLELGLPLNVENIIKTTEHINDSICKYENASDDSQHTPKEIFHSAICSLAEFTAKSIETFHKITELIMVQQNFDQDLEQCATNLTGLTTVMCIEINNMSSRYHKSLDESAEHFKNQASSEHFDSTILATNLYVEAANSNNYIQDAYQMLVPVLQVCLLEAIE